MRRLFSVTLTGNFCLLNLKTESSSNYYKVEISSIKPNQLSDRTLYVYLLKNQRIVPVVRAFQFIDEVLFEKLNQLNTLYSPELSIYERAPKLIYTARFITETLDDAKQVSFEKNHTIFDHLGWLIPSLLHTENSGLISVFLMHHILQTPGASLLKLAYKKSVTTYERALKISSTATLLALILGYCHRPFLVECIGTIFKDEFQNIIHKNEVFSELAACSQYFCGLSEDKSQLKTRIAYKIEQLISLVVSQSSKSRFAA